jgi:hypothetical protein
VLINNRWIDPRKQVLNVPIAYWYMSPVSRCSYVTTWPKHLSHTSRLSRGRKNEVIQDDGQTSLFFIAKISFRCRGMFQPREDYAKDYYKLISSARHKLTAGKRSHRGQVLLGTLVASTVLGKAGGQGQNARGQDLPCFPFRVV